MVEISNMSIDMIVGFEVSSPSYYQDNYTHFDWPGEASGPTVGIGYDLGYVTLGECRADWSPWVTPTEVAILISAIGLTGERAHQWVQDHRDEVTISYPQAVHEFIREEVPKWEARCRAALENFDLLSPDSAGALVSLAYNRGVGGFHSSLPRYAEMRKITDLMAAAQYALIPTEIAAMARLWPNETGLQVRRRQEAALFAKGVKDCKQPGSVVVATAPPPPAPPAKPQERPVTVTPVTTHPDVVAEIEAALEAAENELPQLLSVLSIFIPGLNALRPFLSLLPVAIEAVKTIHTIEGQGTQSAVASVVQTLTPGQPGAPSLN